MFLIWAGGVVASYCYLMYRAAIQGGTELAIFESEAGPWFFWWFLMSLAWPLSIPGMFFTQKGLRIHKELKEQKQLLLEEGLE